MSSRVLGRRRAVQELTTRHPEIEQVILFGSLARGEPCPGRKPPFYE